MHKTFLALFLTFAALGVTAEASSKPSDTSQIPTNRIVDTMKFEQVFILGLQGDMTRALTFLDSLYNPTLTLRQRRLKERYYSRFRQDNDLEAYRTQDSVVIELIKLYESYWRTSLLYNDSLSQCDSVLADMVMQYLYRHAPMYKDSTREGVRGHFDESLGQFLHNRGIFAATGKTGPFYDLLMHSTETDSTYQVETPEEKIDVKVVFMEDVISNGWEEYATFGKYFPGGWATSDALYCVKGTYDLQSEDFTVSYLKHEGKHFADYKRFPHLTGADLEYRAKLVELSAAEQSLSQLCRFFSNNSTQDRQNPHGFANYCVIRDLSHAFGRSTNDADLEWWKAIPTSDIHSHAIALLKQNSANLFRAGADTVTTILR